MGRRPRTIVSPREGIVIERRVAEQHPDGLARIDQHIESRDVIERSIVTDKFWIFAAVLREDGLTEALCAGGWRPLPRRRVFLIPPRSVLRLRLTEVRLAAHGIVGQVPLSAALASVPCCAALEPSASVPDGMPQIESSLGTAVGIDPDEGVADTARLARRLLHEVLDDPRPVAQVARRIGVAPETVTRAFGTAYRVSPKTYVHGARVSNAVLSLLTGSSVLSAGLDAGFGHPSRFYEIFRRLTGNTPGEYTGAGDQEPRRRPRRTVPT